jgi:hypothetical protein
LVQSWWEHWSQLPCCVLPGLHAPSFVHAPHWQLLSHVCVPQLPHACVAPGLQPLIWQAPATHWQLLLQVSISVEQAAHWTVRVAPGMHPSFWQVPAVHMQLAPHTSIEVPQLPHALMRVAFGAHSPCDVHVPNSAGHVPSF